MKGLKKAADMHRAMFVSYLTEMGTLVTVRQYPDKAATGGSEFSKVFGNRNRENEVGSTSEVRAVVSASVSGQLEPREYAENSAVLGLFEKSDVVLRVLLEDVLLDPTKPLERTLFDTAKEIVVQGSEFELAGSARTGLPPLGPYILWVGLKATGR
jgi:hypothetical protein